MYKPNIEARLLHYFCRGKARSITYSECVSVALVIQHAKCTGRTVLPSVACPAVPRFSTLSHKWQDFRKKVTEHKNRRFDFFCNFCLKYFSFKKNSARQCHKCAQVCM
jgi:hypothetical protein